MQSAQWLVDAPVTVITGNASARFELFWHRPVPFRWSGRLRIRSFTRSCCRAFDVYLDQAREIRSNGGRVGIVVDYRNGPFFAEALGSLTVGRNDADIHINGTKFTDTPMSWVPEFGLKVGYQLGESLWITAGYSLIYLRDVYRPGIGVTHFTVHGITVGFEFRF